MRKLGISLGLFAIVSMSMVSCQSRQGTGSAIGAGVGTLGGLVLANNTGLSDFEGAAIGAAFGALSGYVISDLTKPEKVRSRQRAAQRHNYNTQSQPSSKYQNPESQDSDRDQDQTQESDRDRQRQTQQAQEMEYTLESVRINKNEVTNGEKLTVTSNATILTPRRNQNVNYGIYFQFNPQNDRPLGIEKRPHYQDMSSGTWRHNTSIKVQNLNPGVYDLRVHLVNDDGEIQDSVSKRIRVVRP